MFTWWRWAKEHRSKLHQICSIRIWLGPEEIASVYLPIKIIDTRAAECNSSTQTVTVNFVLSTDVSLDGKCDDRFSGRHHRRDGAQCERMVMRQKSMQNKKFIVIWDFQLRKTAHREHDEFTVFFSVRCYFKWQQQASVTQVNLRFHHMKFSWNKFNDLNWNPKLIINNYADPTEKKKIIYEEWTMRHASIAHQQKNPAALPIYSKFNQRRCRFE